MASRPSDLMSGKREKASRLALLSEQEVKPPDPAEGNEPLVATLWTKARHTMLRMLNQPNRRVRTRMHGGVGGGKS